MLVACRTGVHWLKDPDTGEYNFDQHLEDIPKVSDFDFSRLGGFVTSSQDKACQSTSVWAHPLILSFQTLIDLAKKNDCKYAGSTSSLTGILTQIYLLLSREKLLKLYNLSEAFQDAVSDVLH